MQHRTVAGGYRRDRRRRGQQLHRHVRPQRDRRQVAGERPREQAAAGQQPRFRRRRRIIAPSGSPPASAGRVSWRRERRSTRSACSRASISPAPGCRASPFARRHAAANERYRGRRQYPHGRCAGRERSRLVQEEQRRPAARRHRVAPVSPATRARSRSTASSASARRQAPGRCRAGSRGSRQQAAGGIRHDLPGGRHPVLQRRPPRPAHWPLLSAAGRLARPAARPQRYPPAEALPASAGPW